jgi:hypothetical protein
VTAYLAGVQERLRLAELERAAAQAKAAEAAAKAAAERRARRLTAGLAAAGLALALVIGGGWLWVQGQRQAQAAAFRVGMEQATGLLQGEQWGPARAAVKALPEPEDEADRRRVREFLADLDMLERVTEIWASKADRFGPDDDDAEYAQAFRDYGIDVDARDAAEAADRIRARPDVVARGLVGAVIDWADVRRQHKPDSPDWGRLVAVVRAADPDPWRHQLLDFKEQKDLAALRRLALDPDTLTQPAQSLQLLGWFLADADGPAAAVSFLRKAQRRHPGNPWINRDLASRLERLRPPRTEEAIGFYRAAVAVRPELNHQLAKTLALKGDLDEAVILYQDLALPHFW